MMLMDQTKVHQQFVILALTVAWKPKSNRYLYMRPVFVSVQSPLDWKFYFDIDDVVKTLLLLSGDWIIGQWTFVVSVKKMFGQICVK